MILGIPVPGEEMELIEEINPTSGASIIFAGIPQSFDDLMIVFRSVTCDTGAVLSILFNGDATLTNYARQFWRHYDAAEEAASGQDAQIGRAGTAVQEGWSGLLWLPRYSEISDKKIAQCMGSFGATRLNNFRNVLWNNAAAINQIKIEHTQTNFLAPTKILLYGIRRRRTQ